MLRWSCALLTALILTGAPDFAHAQQAPADERARLHFQSGRSYFDTGDYELALREFNRAYELSKRPELFYNISLVYERLGNLEKAVEYLERYLAEVEDLEDRHSLELKVQNLKKRIEAEQTGEPTDEAPSKEQPPSDGDGDGDEVEDQDEDAAAEATPPRATRPPTPEQPRQRGGGFDIPVVTWVSYGIGGGALLMAIATGITAGVMTNDLENDCGEMGCLASEKQDNVDTINALAVVTDLGLLVAVVGGVVGTTVLLTSDDSDERLQTEKPGPSVSITPWAHPRGDVGASAEVRF